MAIVVNFTVPVALPEVTVAVYSVDHLSCLSGIHLTSPEEAGAEGEPEEAEGDTEEPVVDDAGAGEPEIDVPEASFRVTVAVDGAENTRSRAVETSFSPSLGDVMWMGEAPGVPLLPGPFHEASGPEQAPSASAAVSASGVNRRNRM
ncbi:hypothetical protein [Dactylosporangium sp. CA-139066]|uniref:hypothetical protein n=1 Tax=Dactylosporangium sp. CA-139066 TaxID=3239930 RepID=UPI003D8C9EA0